MEIILVILIILAGALVCYIAKSVKEFFSSDSDSFSVTSYFSRYGGMNDYGRDYGNDYSSSYTASSYSPHNPKADRVVCDDCDYESYYEELADDAVMGDSNAIEEMHDEFGDDWEEER